MDKTFIGMVIVLYLFWISGLIHHYIRYQLSKNPIKTSFKNYIYNNTNAFDFFNQMMLVFTAILIVMSLGFLIGCLI
jgi:ABC-type phosphate transport system permease subunit